VVLVYGLLQAIRLFFASKGNKTETVGPLISAGVLGAVVALAYVYSLALQTYVLKLDVVLASIGLVFVGLQTLLSLGTGLAFYNAYRG
jgi:Predicted membrane protein